MTHCKSCGAPIIWAENVATKKRIPLDANPEAEGKTRYRLIGTGTCEKVTEATEEATYVSHFETCPNAKQHSKAGGK